MTPVLASLLLLLFLSAAPDDAIRATVECPKISAPGRVRCELRAEVPAPRGIQWADVEIVRAPPFLVPLKGRIGPADVTAKDATGWRFGFALVARETGEGDVGLRLRAVVCERGRCLPHQIDVAAHVVVAK
jgi:hypothetical protein